MKTDRLVGIIMILLQKERLGAQELADMFEVSPRTIYRDIDAINMAGIPVRAVPGVGGGFEIMPEYKVDKKIFSSADLSAIVMGLSNLSSVVREDELANALAKVKSLIPADRANDIELRANQIYIDLRPWIGNESIQPNLELIKAALQQGRLLAFEYTDRHGDKSSRTVEPYQLVLKGRHWYLQGYCHTREDYRLFKLARISKLQMLSETFTPREYESPALDFSEALEAVQMRIKLRIHRSVMDRVLDLCSFEGFTPDGEEHYIVSFPFVENDYNYDVLLSFGDKCECLAPPRVREEMKRRTRSLAAIYND